MADWLVRERRQGLSNGLLHATQLLFAYNSSHMEGSTITAEQTAEIYETGTLLAERDAYQATMETLAPGRIEYSYHDSWDRSAAPTHAENPFLKDTWDEADLARYGIEGNSAETRSR